MEREFIQTNVFLKRWEEIGLTEDDLQELEIHLCENPLSGDLIAGTGGVRKLRWQIIERGKRSGARVIYVDFTADEILFLLTAYDKKEQEDLSMEQRKMLYSLVKQLEEERKPKL